MILTSDAFKHNDRIPPRYAFCQRDGNQGVVMSENINPPLRWSGYPTGTRSFALICHDADVPSVGDDVNQADREIPSDLPRVDFFHWSLANLPPSVTSISEGEYSSGITPRGKTQADTHHGAQQGVNDYTGWFATDADMSGMYFGYDGPCPPWNDSIVHGYVFTVYALDVAELVLPEGFTGHDLRHAMQGHVLAEASLVGLYSLNPRLS